MDINGNDFVYIPVDKSMRKGRDSIRCAYKKFLQVLSVRRFLLLRQLKTILIFSF